MLAVDPEAVAAAASRWQVIGANLGQGGAPPVALTKTWPSAAATNKIHERAGAATGAFQERIDGTAAASTQAANTFQTHETVKAGEIKDVMSLVTSPLHDVIGIAGSLGSASSSIAGTVAQLGGQAVSVTTNLANTLTSALSHAGDSTHTASMVDPTDHSLGHGDSNSQSASMPPQAEHPRNPGATAPGDQPPVET
jgi:hypothetical protein